MAHYRLFFMGPDDHIVRAQVVECATDGEAVAVARASCSGHSAIEVWERARKVERVPGDGRVADRQTVVQPSGRERSDHMAGGRSETASHAYPELKAMGDYGVSARSYDAVGDWLQLLAKDTA